MLIPPNRRIPAASTQRVYQGDYMEATPLTLGSKRLLINNGVTDPATLDGYHQFRIKSPSEVFEDRNAVRMGSVHGLIALYFEKLRIVDDLRSPPMAFGHGPVTNVLRDGSRIVQRARCGNVEFCGPILWSMGKPLAHAVRLTDTETVVLIKTSNHAHPKARNEHRNMLTNMINYHENFVREGRVEYPYDRTITVWHTGTIRNLYNANQVVGLADEVKKCADRVIMYAASLAKASAESYDRRYYSNEITTTLTRMHRAHRLLDIAMDMREEWQSRSAVTDVYPLPQPIVDRVNLAYALANAGAHPMLAREHEEEVRVKLLNAMAIHALES